MLRGGHEPGARVVRDARLRPLLERGDESVLRELLGEADVAHDPREAGDEPGRLDPPDRVDRAMGVGSRHGYRSHHLRSAGASQARRVDGSASRPLCVASDCACSSGNPAAASWTSAGSPRTPAPGGSRSPRCPKRGSATPIRSPLPSTSPGSSSSRRAPPSPRRTARRSPWACRRRTRRARPSRAGAGRRARAARRPSAGTRCTSSSRRRPWRPAWCPAAAFSYPLGIISIMNRMVVSPLFEFGRSATRRPASSCIRRISRLAIARDLEETAWPTRSPPPSTSPGRSRSRRSAPSSR